MVSSFYIVFLKAEHNLYLTFVTYLKDKIEHFYTQTFNLNNGIQTDICWCNTATMMFVYRQH